MSLELIEQSIRVAHRNSMAIQAWRETEDLRARKVEEFREYADGSHPDHLTSEQKRLLNRVSSTGSSAPFTDNLCSIILDTPLDRIQLLGVKASAPTAAPSAPPLPSTDTPAADPLQEWVDTLLQRNRLDALQVDVHEAALRDGNTFLMVYPDEDTRLPRFSHEPAYDGSYGMVVLYETTNSDTPLLALKIWRITNTELADTVRVNVYYPDRIERFSGTPSSGLKPFADERDGATIPWVIPGTGEPLGVPVVHFRNRGSSADNFGLSELENVIPLQDASNVVLTSLVATALLSGFPIRAAIGFEAPAAVVPGLVMSINAKNAAGGLIMDKIVGDYLASVRLDQYPVADLSQLIAVAAYLKGEMYAVTNTPTDDVAADASGEARKQSEVKLIGKVRRFEVRNGNAWEDAVHMAARVQAAFAAEAPPVRDETTLTAQWADPEIRNDSAFVADMLTQYREGVIDQRTYLEAVAGIYDWDAEKINEIITRTEAARNAAPANALNQNDADGAQALIEQAMGQQANKNENGANGNV